MIAVFCTMLGAFVTMVWRNVRTSGPEPSGPVPEAHHHQHAS